VIVFMSEEDVGSRLSMDAVLRAVRRSFHRLAEGSVRQEPFVRLQFQGGSFAAVCAADGGLGLASVKSLTEIHGAERGFLLSISSLHDGSVRAVIEAELLTALRTGAASGIAAASLASSSAKSLGIIGCGRQAVFQVDAVRRCMPNLISTVAWCRRREKLMAFCERTGSTPAASAREASSQDIVVTATNSPTPVVSGDWLDDGTLVIAIGGERHGDRELDDAVIERAGLITCDSIASSRAEAADLWLPAETHLLSWDDVVELHDIVAKNHPGRTSDSQIIVFKSNGLAAWDVAAAAELVDSGR
jgi:ornithine cyclodeaminase/alanine dehydrogenase-like protein (mu-crystallin family)